MLEDGREVVIQFRPEPLDIKPFEARPGAKVPEGNTPQRGYPSCDLWAECLPRDMLPKPSRTATTIDGHIRPHLQLILASNDAQIRQFHSTAHTMLAKLDKLKILPLFVAHFDLNDVNIMVDNNYEVSGIVDWELSTPLPFGMGFARIHTLAGEYSDRKFCVPDEFEDAERGFWEEIQDGIPDHVRKVFKDSPELIQDAVLLGTLLDAFQLDDGKIGGYNQAVVEALPKLLTYQLPMVRGDASPYSV
ncbi:hypothetical protein K461DRAFT_308246 [Myriangium duriaei CBS 260.36]|uniref:Aminoglycoside phosphotransferase domain-containing protein n=1 Tax=Myriangium duriaei CBS 260.36 TaxID=1168546 RepID=A0A9P4IYW1_9PEZI|nr:hypothetical protein K461DRAFT_308246 [Myriangium duriaei CBS 260.36]